MKLKAYKNSKSGQWTFTAKTEDIPTELMPKGFLIVKVEGVENPKVEESQKENEIFPQTQNVSIEPSVAPQPSEQDKNIY